jgi:hypothetical protein
VESNGRTYKEKNKVNVNIDGTVRVIKPSKEWVRWRFGPDGFEIITKIDEKEIQNNKGNLCR